MRLVLLGHSNAGKTTFIASNYAEMRHYQPQGLWLHLPSNGEHDRLIQVYEGVLNKRYPDATDVRAEYEFELRHHDEVILPFGWRDYRGGALRDPSHLEDVKALQNDLAACDGVFVFLDGNTPTGLAGKADLGRLGQWLTAAAQHGNRRLPVVLVMTKADLVSDPVRRAWDLFEPMRVAIAASDQLYGAVVPVSCIPESPCPGRQPLYAPLLFLLHHKVRETAAVLQRLHRERAEQACRHRNSARRWFGLVSWLEHRLSGVSGHTRAWAAEQQAADALRRLLPINRSLNALAPLVAPLPTFGSLPRN